MIETINALATNPLVTNVVGIIFGYSIAQYYLKWRYSRTPSQIDVINESIAHGILAEESFRILSEEERELVSDRVDTRMKDEFGDEAGFEHLNE